MEENIPIEEQHVHLACPEDKNEGDFIFPLAQNILDWQQGRNLTSIWVLDDPKYIIEDGKIISSGTD